VDERDGDEPEPRRSSSGAGKPPGKVTGLGIMCLIGGIYAILWALGFAGGSCGLFCLWPPIYYSIVLGILAIIRGAGLLGASSYQQYPPIVIGIMMIINILNADIVNTVLGIIVLVFCGDEEVKAYLRK
jgi:hypothetical protein